RSLLGSVLALGELIEFAQDLLPIGIRSSHRLPFATDRSFEGVAHLIAHGFRAVDGCSSQFGIPAQYRFLTSSTLSAGLGSGNRIEANWKILVMGVTVIAIFSSLSLSPLASSVRVVERLRFCGAPVWRLPRSPRQRS